MSKILFDPRSSFFQLPIVRWTGLFIGLVALLVIAWIIYSSGLELDTSYVGINNLITIFKVPIGVLALLIPVGALYAANHRSEQNRLATNMAEQQNLFANYFKHIDEFCKYIDAYSGKGIEIRSKRRLHHFLYGGRGDFRAMLQHSAIQEFASEATRAAELFCKLYGLDNSDLLDEQSSGNSDTKEACDGIRSITARLEETVSGFLNADTETTEIDFKHYFNSVECGLITDGFGVDMLRISYFVEFLNYAIEFDTFDSELPKTAAKYVNLLNGPKLVFPVD